MWPCRSMVVVALPFFGLAGVMAEQVSCSTGGNVDACPQEDASLLSMKPRTKLSPEQVLTQEQLDTALADYLAKREAEDLDSLNSVKALSNQDVDYIIRRRQGLNGQATFSPIPPNCGGWDCLFPGMSGNDNGQGLRAFGHQSLNGPAAAHVSLSWDVELIYFHASMIGGLFHGGMYNAALGPGAQVWRNPACGRSWEYVPGEDPVLGVRLVEAWTLGLNRRNVAPVWKHFINNDKENERMHRVGNLTVPWESQMDVYLKPFVAGSNIGAASTMCGYHWMVDPEGGEPVSACFNKRLKWLYEESNRTWVVTDYPAAEMFEEYTEPISRSDAGHSWANYGFWKQPLHYEHRDAKQQFSQSEGVVEEDNGHQVMASNLGSVDRAKKDRYLAGFVGWAKDLGVHKTGPVYTKDSNNRVWEQKDSQDKARHYKWTSRTIAESLVLLKNEGNLLPLRATETVALDASCTGERNAGLMTAHGSGEMNIHLKETKAETAFQGKTGGTPKVTLVCSLMTAGEGTDRDIRQTRPEIVDKASTCVLISGAGSTAISWADDVACIIFGLAPSVHAFTGVMYFMYGVVNPGAHLILSVVKDPDDLQFSDGDSKRETGYMMLQAGSKAPAFEFGWGLPFSVKESWSELVELIPMRHQRDLRRISFCFKAKDFDVDTAIPLPSPTAQFYAQVQGRPWKQLLTFTKFRHLRANAWECMAIFYDPVAEWEGGNDDGSYVQKPFSLFYGLEGYSSSVAWPSELEQGEDPVREFSRGGYPAQVWRRHVANQLETGSRESEGKIFVQRGRVSKDAVSGFWENVHSPDAPHENANHRAAPVPWDQGM